MKSGWFFCVSLLTVVLFSGGGLLAGEDGIRAEIKAGSLRVRVGEEVAFSAAGSRAGKGAKLAGFYWDFNDMDLLPVNDSGREVTHVFNRTGAYTVELKVEDEQGHRDSAFCSVEVMPETDEGQSITSNFQGGRTGVFFASDESFAFRLEWGNQFYFRLDNCKGRKTSLKIVGYGPNRKQLPSVTPYRNDHTFDDKYTLMYSTDYQKHDWKPYLEADYAYNDETATLTASFVPEEDSLYFAWAVPWTMRNLRELIGKREDNGFFKWRVLGESLEGRPIIGLTVTDFEVSHKEKKAIWITGTQHAYEMAAGPVIDGIVNRLLDGRADSGELLKKYVYNIVPLMNPDGVYQGGYRYNLHNIDLNRNWDDRKQDDWDREESEPEVACVKEAIDEWVRQNENLDIYMDFHCLTAIAEDLLMIKASPDSIPAEIKVEQDRFVKDFLRKRWFFRESESSGGNGGKGYITEKYAGKTGVISFTAEHCLGFIRTAEGERQRATPELFRQLGRDYVELIDEYFSAPRSIKTGP